MPAKTISRISGITAQTEITNLSNSRVSRLASGTTVTAVVTGQNGFIHIPIPSPLEIDGASMKVTEATVSFTTTGTGRVTEVRVSDGSSIYGRTAGLNLTGFNTFAQGIANDPTFLNSIVVSVFVQLPAIGDSIQLFWADVSFDG